MLEPGRTLTLAEKGGAGAEEVVAAAGFRLVATMNPGGDYGKRELSPALANRFTTVWVPPIEDEAELAQILNARVAGAALIPCVYLFACQLGIVRAGVKARGSDVCTSCKYKAICLFGL